MNRPHLDRSYSVPDPVPGTAHIKLGHGRFTVVDGDKLPELSKHSWTFNTSGYAETRTNNRTITLHRFLMPGVVEVDHVNLVKLDNRLCNLRAATSQQNKGNQSKHRQNKSGYKGVHWHPQGKKWRAQIRFDRKSRHIGLFEGVEDAARAYDSAALQYFGEFARLNFPATIH